MSTISPPDSRVMQSLIHVRDLGRRTVARHHDLTRATLQRVQEAQQLRLRLAPSREELDVVEQQHVHAAVALLEALPLVRGDRGVQLLDEVLERDILDAEIGLQLLHEIADRAHQVRLAEPRAAVDEERIVREPRWLGDGVRRRHGESIRRADDEVVEPVCRASTCIAIAPRRR